MAVPTVEKFIQASLTRKGLSCSPYLSRCQLEEEMSHLVQKLFQPALNPVWSNKVLSGSFHKEALVEMSASFSDAAPVAARLSVCLDVLEPITYRTAQASLIIADRLVAAPVNVLAAASGVVTGWIGIARELSLMLMGRAGNKNGLWAAAKIGAAFGFDGIRSAYTFGVRIGLCCCSFVAFTVGLPMRLVHVFVPRVHPQPATVAKFSPLPSNKIQSFLQGLDGQGGAIMSINGLQVAKGSDAHSWKFDGEVKALFGLIPVAQFYGSVTADDKRAKWMTITVPAREGINAINLAFSPSLLGGRLHMTGRATGFHFWEQKPISQDLSRLGYRKEEGTWPEDLKKLHACDDTYPQDGRFMRFSRPVRGGVEDQEIVYNGGWRDGFSMGSVELNLFPFAVATKLGMLLYLDS